MKCSATTFVRLSEVREDALPEHANELRRLRASRYDRSGPNRPTQEGGRDVGVPLRQ
jgi:hypothetical protein